jgi:hypothetical protein
MMAGADLQEIKEQGCKLEFGRKGDGFPLKMAILGCLATISASKFNVKVWRHSGFHLKMSRRRAGRPPCPHQVTFLLRAYPLKHKLQRKLSTL